MIKKTNQASDFFKKPYEKPLITVYLIKTESILTGSASTESLDEEDYSWG